MRHELQFIALRKCTVILMYNSSDFIYGVRLRNAIIFE